MRVPPATCIQQQIVQHAATVVPFRCVFVRLLAVDVPGLASSAIRCSRCRSFSSAIFCSCIRSASAFFHRSSAACCCHFSSSRAYFQLKNGWHLEADAGKLGSGGRKRLRKKMGGGFFVGSSTCNHVQSRARARVVCPRGPSIRLRLHDFVVPALFLPCYLALFLPCYLVANRPVRKLLP